MDAGAAFKAGKLAEALSKQTELVKTHPADQSKRLFLFELLAFSGQWDRAARQADAIRYEEVELETAAQGYRKLVESELRRQQWWQAGKAPEFFSPPTAATKLRLEAANLIRGGKPQEAAGLLAQAAGQEPAIAGTLNDKPFTALRDCDDLWGPVIEVMAHGSYYWVPLEQVDTISVTRPKFPRDLLWLPALLSIKDGPAGNVFLPGLYPGSSEHPDDQVKLGRLTDWLGEDGNPVLGVGQHTYLVDEEPIGLWEWEQLTMAS